MLVETVKQGLRFYLDRSRKARKHAYDIAGAPGDRFGGDGARTSVEIICPERVSFSFRYFVPGIFLVFPFDEVYFYLHIATSRLNNNGQLNMEGVVPKFKQGARGFVRVSDEVLVKARRLGMYGASELIAQRLRSLAQSSIPVAHGAFNFRKDMWLFRIEDNQVLDLNLLTPDNTLKSETGTYRQKRARLSRERGTAGASARPSPAEQEAQNGPVTGNDARSDGSHSVGNLQSRGRQISTEERNKTIREIFVWRSKHLDKALEALANAARQYADELIRDDKLHAARLRQRRENMFIYIRLARELMADWPITDEDVFTWIEQEKWLKLSD